MSDSDPGPKPDPVVEPGEPNPGGVDAVPQADGVDGEDAQPDPLSRDLHPDENPATGEVPIEMKETEDTSTEATEDADPGGEDSEDGTESQEAPA